ncbi:hypothetical protein WNY51_08890 [Pseudocolwellia sp. AS88]|uniref:hypothetical protein n=1 Tax=Pseudocolwellia sp. AS88 TaxID=3063958 RepID=UPI0026EF457F|nr:hypothetical protein [Pseudocolwellia sp. AS88]MDO7086500.1 hypothetical protein [Pseudocolwellia sp. AS88]
MELTITDLNVDINSENMSLIREKTRKVFNKVCGNIQKVTITINDINGPKGGKDKLCKVVLFVRGMPDIVVTDNQSSVSSAVNVALSRARVTLIKKLKRKQKNMPNLALKGEPEVHQNEKASITF